MRVAVDISLYPLTEEFLTPIKDVIRRFKAHDSVDVETNAMSTQIRGEYDAVMNVLRAEMRETFEQVPKAVFAIRILNNPLSN
ncbi:MAG TPA: YkoF family thiamine/hydroxymethylpyrimidine-binding protein [Woeseiaceae bacterium]|nr:YkoF family thiamine/hydroxymethylpyrimidine-binding protein [Woeseiaceae bacterium]